ncbi:hypothetical protein PR048_004723 [Dryococelus australis]|uniref:Integrase catalytic domain-containing protein n=1 Tax=Dryococelus australis TaxID=614101 RepID=A0ABQ9I666_9NEOP|nr:hypothetical protein PR048_004723 [Dryococelus australis]
MWGHRLVIPNKLHNSLLSDLHSIYMGMVKSKSLAQSILWIYQRENGFNNIGCNSKWVDVFPMDNSTSSKTIIALRQYFCNWGLPFSHVTDNGSSLTSEEFQTFLRNNGVQHITTTFHTPHSNGAAENDVKTFTASFKKQLWQGENSTKAVQAFLFMYSTTPHMSTEYSPGELQMGRP